jgi:hypothetical protein
MRVQCDFAKFRGIVRQCLEDSRSLEAHDWMEGSEVVFRQVRGQQEERMYSILVEEVHGRALSIRETILGDSSDTLARYCTCLAAFAASTAALHRISANLHRFWMPEQPRFDRARNEARAAALSILLIWHLCHSALSVLPLEIVTMIARLVYRSRVDVDVWAPVDKEGDDRVRTAYELGIRTWNRIVLGKVFDQIAPAWSLQHENSREKMLAHVNEEFRKGIDLLYGPGRAPKKLTL